MEESKVVRICMITLFLLATQLHCSFVHGSSDIVRKLYIVYTGEAPKSKISATDLHHNLLSSVVQDAHIAQQSKIHSYTKSFNAFAANLLPDEVRRLQENEYVVSVFPSRIRKLHTTRSWDFLRMPPSVKRNHQIESNVIVGVLDTGIYMDAPSFDDKGYGPPPSKWKGSCQVGVNFAGCNNKVIGAKFFHQDKTIVPSNLSPADEEGHGTHTSSTIAGVLTPGASLYGLANGIARGGVPSARIAMYKVCWGVEGCSDVDLLAGMEEAISDGVDLISVSIGEDVTSYFTDPIAIGAFHAMTKGILTTCSGGNDGPYPNTVQNAAPWIMTVGASSMDRQFSTSVKLGNGIETDGLSVNTFSPKRRIYPLTSAAKASNSSITPDSSPWSCDYGGLGENKVKGKIVLCKNATAEYIKEIGGIGMITSRQDQLDTGFTCSIPAANVDANAFIKIDTYINSTKNPQVVIFKSKAVRNMAAPFVASFSSRGPPNVSPTILKPDIVAPGIDILAAYTKLTSTTGDPSDDRFTVYNIISGTSMACPHVTAAAAYVKSFHPDWSPAAIKSALMTTASEMKLKDEHAELAYGAGQIDPVSALQPGLIYNLSKSDYIRFLCNEGYTGIALSLFTSKYTNCSSVPNIGGQDALNYPSMSLQLNNSKSSISAIFHRTVTNVGSRKAIYKATVKAPANLKVNVVPKELAFIHLHESKSFTVVIKGPPLNNITSLSASLEWSDDKHRVKSPILIYLPPSTF